MVEYARLTWHQYRLERKMFWRNPTAAFFIFVLPLLFLALFGALYSGSQDRLDVIVPGVAGLAVMATTFNALAMGITILRDQGVLKRIHGTPLPGGAYLCGLIGSAVTNAAVQLVLVIVAGKLFFGTPWPQDWVELIVFSVAGVTCFASLGIALSYAIPNAESAAAYTNAIFLPMIFISGVFYRADDGPEFLRAIAEGLPLKHLVDGLSGALVTGQTLSDNLTALAVVAVWAALGIVLAVRGFRWENRRS
jgi:ABC-2 type transport system permease protein